jgi:nicotinamide-nucleotide amidase
VFLSISGASGTTVRELGLTGDRWQIRKSAVSAAVSGLLDRVQETSAG